VEHRGNPARATSVFLAFDSWRIAMEALGWASPSLWDANSKDHAIEAKRNPLRMKVCTNTIQISPSCDLHRELQIVLGIV
jgi:hypothetical protein